MVRRVVAGCGVGVLTVGVLVGGAGGVGAQSAPPPQMGMHIPEAAFGIWPDVPVGSIRLWDTYVSWREINTAPGVYNWATLDKVMALAEANGADVLYAFGSTPEWAARSGCRGQADVKGPQASCPPADNATFVAFAKELATRYKGRIDGYEMWNEGNIGTFWKGTPEELAAMTLAGGAAIKAADPQAKVVSASMTTRLDTAFSKFMPIWLDKMAAANWPIDAFAIHSYPAGALPGGSIQDQGERAIAARNASITKVWQALRAAGMPNRVEVWDTELNYGLAGPGPIPSTDYPDPLGPGMMAQSYFDSQRLGVARTYWFSWGKEEPEKGVNFGIVTDRGSSGGQAFGRYGMWLTTGQIPAGVPRCVPLGPRAGVPGQVCALDAKGERVLIIPAADGPMPRWSKSSIWPADGPCRPAGVVPQARAEVPFIATKRGACPRGST